MLSELLLSVGDNLRTKNLVNSEVIRENDVHAFYRLVKNPSKVIYVRGYTGISNEKNALISARMMDYEKMMKIRKSGRVSLGNENQAIIEVFQNFNFEAGIMMPYDANLLVEKLAENVEELREIEKVSKNII